MSVIRPSTPTGYSMFCDDIRQEDNGKQFLIGLYSSEMLITSFPTILPSFRVLINYQERMGESRLPVKLVVTAPNGTGNDVPIFEAELAREDMDKVQAPPDGNDEPYVSVGINAAFTPFILAHPGRIKVRAYRGEDEIRLGTLRVILRSEWEAEQKRRSAPGNDEAAN